MGILSLSPTPIREPSFIPSQVNFMVTSYHITMLCQILNYHNIYNFSHYKSPTPRKRDEGKLNQHRACIIKPEQLYYTRSGLSLPYKGA